MRGCPRDQRGQTTLVIVAFATFLAMLVAVVVDATAAYLQRQSLSTLADGAALQGADLGASGDEVYSGGLRDDRLDLTHAEATRAVGAYLRSVGAASRYPGLTFTVRLDATTSRIEVSVRAPLDLPITFPGSPERAEVGAVGSAIVDIEDP